MIKIENVEVSGFPAAIRGMRNPLNSWYKSDSCYCFDLPYDKCMRNRYCSGFVDHNDYIVGENDLSLMKRLSAAGTDHGKFMRFINVTFDCVAPLYWWKEACTYRIGVESNSCSTMHKIHSKDFTIADFSVEHLDDESLDVLSQIISRLNTARIFFLRYGDKSDWWQMIQLLPSSYNQRRTVLLNYQVLRAMYHARRNHKLDEWHEFCGWIEKLPYSKLITTESAK